MKVDMWYAFQVRKVQSLCLVIKWTLQMTPRMIVVFPYLASGNTDLQWDPEFRSISRGHFQCLSVWAWDQLDRLDRQDLVGSLIITNCRVVHTLEELLRQTGCRGHPTGYCLQVWALDRDRTTYNVSVPHRAHVAALLSFHWTCWTLFCSTRTRKVLIHVQRAATRKAAKDNRNAERGKHRKRRHRIGTRKGFWQPVKLA